MTNRSLWNELGTEYLSHVWSDNPVAAKIGQFRQNDPLDVTEALDKESASAGKQQAIEFLLFAIRGVIEDRRIEDDEVRVFRHVARLLRINEGDLVNEREQEVRELICQEMERLLADQTIDIDEAMHKVKLQEMLGLSYDQFVTLSAPEIEKVIIRLAQRFDPGGEAQSSPAAMAAFHRQLTSLDTVFDLNSVSRADERCGYLYLLVNPAMPGLVKVGRTAKVPTERVAELTSATGVPTPFVLLYEIFVEDAAAAESFVHSRLEEIGQRFSPNREFFTAVPSEVVEIMLQARDAVDRVG